MSLNDPETWSLERLLQDRNLLFWLAALRLVDEPDVEGEGRLKVEFLQHGKGLLPSRRRLEAFFTRLPLAWLHGFSHDRLANADKLVRDLYPSMLFAPACELLGALKGESEMRRTYPMLSTIFQRNVNPNSQRAPKGSESLDIDRLDDFQLIESIERYQIVGRAVLAEAIDAAYAIFGDEKEDAEIQNFAGGENDNDNTDDTQSHKPSDNGIALEPDENLNDNFVDNDKDILSDLDGIEKSLRTFLGAVTGSRLPKIDFEGQTAHINSYVNDDSKNGTDYDALFTILQTSATDWLATLHILEFLGGKLLDLAHSRHPAVQLRVRTGLIREVLENIGKFGEESCKLKEARNWVVVWMLANLY